MDYFEKIKPKFYKKTIFIGKRPIIKFTSAGIRKFLFQILWAFVVAVMITSMILGGIALTGGGQ